MKKINTQLMRTGKALFALVLFTTLSGSALAQTQQYPIDFYLSKVGPALVQAWGEPGTGKFIAIDAYNKRNTFFNLGLPTVTDGKVTVRPVKDGMVQVSVNGHTRNAFCAGSGADGIAFGFGLAEVLNDGRPAALGNVNYQIVYAPQPARQPFNVNGPQEFFSASVHCEGPLRAGSGYAEGTPGFAQTRQTGVYGANPAQGCPPEQNANCYPAEKVQFKPRG